MVKRSARGGPPKPVHQPDPKAAWGPERHSGEGSASALEILQKLEKRRIVPRPPAEQDPDLPDKTPDA